MSCRPKAQQCYVPSALGRLREDPEGSCCLLVPGHHCLRWDKLFQWRTLAFCPSCTGLEKRHSTMVKGQDERKKNPSCAIKQLIHRNLPLVSAPSHPHTPHSHRHRGHSSTSTGAGLENPASKNKPSNSDANVKPAVLREHGGMWSRHNLQHSCLTSNKSFHKQNENITSLRNGILIISLRSSSNACYVYFDPHYHTHCSSNTIFPWKY